MLHLQVVFGLIGGIIAGVVLGATKFFNNRYKRLIGIYGAGKCLVSSCAFLCLLLGFQPSLSRF